MDTHTVQSLKRPAAGGDMKARREDERNLRLRRAALNLALGEKECGVCKTVGQWRIHGAIGRIRYVRCQACARAGRKTTDKVVLPGGG